MRYAHSSDVNSKPHRNLGVLSIKFFATSNTSDKPLNTAKQPATLLSNQQYV